MKRRLHPLTEHLRSKALFHSADAVLEADLEIREWCRDSTITDGYALWSAYCPYCGHKSMQVVRPGIVRCCRCDPGPQIDEPPHHD